jgi:peptidyl-prolyl cis-trans isomerase C
VSEPEPIEDIVIVASVNGDVISAQEFERAIEALPVVLQERYRDPARRARYLDEYINRRLVLQAARERGLHEDEALRAKVEDLEERLLIDALQRAVAAEAVTDESLRRYYDANLDEFTDERIRVRQILVRDGTLAEALRVEVESGVDFGTLAREHSLDPSAKRGGDLGFVPKGQMDPAFEAAAFALGAAGDLAPVVKTRYGFHVIELIEPAQVRRRPFEEVRMSLRTRMERNAVRDFTLQLRAEAAIEEIESEAATTPGH